MTALGSGLKDTRIAVVGASSGIGRSIAILAGRSGAKVALGARRVELVEAAAAQAGDAAAGFVCDVSDGASVSGFVEKAVSWLGGLDVVVHAAGTAKLGRVEELDVESWSEMMMTNVVGPATVVAAALPELRQSDRATVALLSTHIVGEPWPALAGYSASKAALEELARGLRVEEPGVRVLTVRVGNTATSFADDWDPERFDRELSSWVEAGLMRHRVLQADEVAGSILAAVADPTGPLELLFRGEEVPPDQLA